MKGLSVIITTISIIVFVTSANADTIQIEADSWCPYNCEPQSSSPGYMIEVAQTVFDKKGIAIKYTNTLWSRALYRVKTGKVDAIVGVSKREAPGLIFPDETLGFSVTVFFTKKGTAWKYTGINSLLRVKLGIQKDYDYGEQIQTYLDVHRKTDKVQVALDGLTMFPLQTNIKKLIAGEIDAIPEDKNVFLYTAKHMGQANAFRYAGSEDAKHVTPENSNVYIAFSPENKHSKKYAQILTEGIRRMRSTGELQFILDKYGLSDWK